MLLYEELLDEAFMQQIHTYEKPLSSRLKGLYSDGIIWINKLIPTYIEKGCVMAEELGHHHTSVGDILDQRNVVSRRQELRARQWGHGRAIPLQRFVDAHKAGVSGRHDLAAYFGVTEEFLQETVDRYRDKHGLYKEFDEKFVVLFDPVDVVEIP